MFLSPTREKMATLAHLIVLLSGTVLLSGLNQLRTTVGIDMAKASLNA